MSAGTLCSKVDCARESSASMTLDLGGRLTVAVEKGSQSDPTLVGKRSQLEICPLWKHHVFEGAFCL